MTLFLNHLIVHSLEIGQMLALLLIWLHILLSLLLGLGLRLVTLSVEVDSDHISLVRVSMMS